MGRSLAKVNLLTENLSGCLPGDGIVNPDRGASLGQTLGYLDSLRFLNYRGPRLVCQTQDCDSPIGWKVRFHNFHHAGCNLTVESSRSLRQSFISSKLSGKAREGNGVAGETRTAEAKASPQVARADARVNSESFGDGIHVSTRNAFA